MMISLEVRVNPKNFTALGTGQLFSGQLCNGQWVIRQWVMVKP